MGSGETAIGIRGLYKEFNSVPAVAGIDLDIKRGEVIGLLGPSGCGKTTTLRCIAGLEEPTNGIIEIEGSVVYNATANVPAERRGLGMVFQSYALWPHMTVFQNVAFALTHSRGSSARERLTRSQIDERVGYILKQLELIHLRDRYPSEVSGGQQQRVAVARAIVSAPKVVLFDEPLSNLDAKLRASVRTDLGLLLRDLEATALYVTHDQSEAMALCDRVAIMKDGKILQLDTPEEVFKNPVEPFVADFLGDANLVPFSMKRSDQSGTVVSLGRDCRIIVPHEHASELPEKGTLVVRRDAVTLLEALDSKAKESTAASTREVETGLTLNGTVKGAFFLGTHTEHVIEVEGLDSLITVDSPRQRLSAGTKCVLVLIPAELKWLGDNESVDARQFKFDKEVVSSDVR